MSPFSPPLAPTPTPFPLALATLFSASIDYVYTLSGRSLPLLASSAPTPCPFPPTAVSLFFLWVCVYLFVSSFCSLGSTCKWDCMVLVSLWLACLLSIMLSGPSLLSHPFRSFHELVDLQNWDNSRCTCLLVDSWAFTAKVPWAARPTPILRVHCTTHGFLPVTQRSPLPASFPVPSLTAGEPLGCRSTPLPELPRFISLSDTFFKSSGCYFGKSRSVMLMAGAAFLANAAQYPLSFFSAEAGPVSSIIIWNILVFAQH